MIWIFVGKTNANTHLNRKQTNEKRWPLFNLEISNLQSRKNVVAILMLHKMHCPIRSAVNFLLQLSDKNYGATRQIVCAYVCAIGTKIIFVIMCAWQKNNFLITNLKNNFTTTWKNLLNYNLTWRNRICYVPNHHRHCASVAAALWQFFVMYR